MGRARKHEIRRCESVRMTSRILISLSLVSLFLIVPVKSRATDLGLSFGSFLPSRILGVREIMNGWAARAGISGAAGDFEIEYFNAHGSGDHYHTVAFDFRLDLEKTSGFSFPLHFNLGLHTDAYQALDIYGNDLGTRTAGGWHYGGGLRYPLGGPQSPIAIRADFKHRFSPGTSLIVLLGVNFSTDSSGSEAP